MSVGKQRVDVDGQEGIDRLLSSIGLAPQHIEQLPEPLFASHRCYEGDIDPDPLVLAQRWLMLLDQRRGYGHGVERIDDDALQAVFCEVRHAFLLPFKFAVHLSYLL